MSILLKAYQSVLETEEGEKLWYPRIAKFGQKVSTSELTSALAELSSLSQGDARSFIQDLTTVMRRFLINGYSVNLEEFGTFTLIVKATGAGVKTREEVNPNQINQLKVRFTPTYKRSSYQGTTRALYSGVSFTMIDKELAKGQDNSSTPGGNDDDDYVDPNA